jgi:hypothetical protein
MWATLPRGTARIQMFHGVGGKYGFDAPAESMRHWDRLFFVNERRRRNFVARRRIDADTPAARLIGCRRWTASLDGSLDRERLLEGFGLDPARPTVLYAPTWSPASSFNRMGSELIGRLLDRPLNLNRQAARLGRATPAAYSVVSTGLAAAPLLDRLAARWQPVGEHHALPGGGGRHDHRITVRPDSSTCCSIGPLVRIDVPELVRQANVHPGLRPAARRRRSQRHQRGAGGRRSTAALSTARTDVGLPAARGRRGSVLPARALRGARARWRCTTCCSCAPPANIAAATSEATPWLRSA